MDLNFYPSTGNNFTFEVGYFDTVLEIKEKINKYQGIPVAKQTLTFNGKVLDDDLNVHYSDILDRSHIRVLIAPDATRKPQDDLSLSKIQLLLKTPMSKLGIALEMDVGETVTRIKEKIHEMEGIPVNRLAIFAKGIELQDHKSMQDCELSNNSEIDVVVRPSPPVNQVKPSSGSSGGSKKIKIGVLMKCGAEKISVEVNSSDYVGELRKKLQQMKLELPEEGYFFIYKQNVMDDDRSFRWHHVCQGDTIEIFGGSVSGGS